MDILEEDMQMVRDFLATANAPFHIQEHFENLIAEHQREADRVVELQEEVDALTDEESARYQNLQQEYEDLQNQKQMLADDRALDALETVKYALHDVIYLGKPLQIMPREMLRIVEEAL